MKDISKSFTPQKLEFIRAGGSYAIVFGKKIQTFAAKTLGIIAPTVFAPSKEISIEGQGLTAVEKIFNRNAVGVPEGKVLHAGSDVRVEVNIVGSQDTTGLMTAQELESMAATVISPIVDGAYQSGCHTASVWDKKAQANIPKLMKFMNEFGVITARDPKGVYHSMTDVIHKVLNDLTVNDNWIIIGGDSHTRMSKGVAFGADSGTVALALATGEASMPIPESVKVTFKGEMKKHMDFRDVVHATQAQMLKQFDGENVFQGRIIEVHIGTLPADQAFTFTDWTAEMKAKASICISEDDTLIESLEIAKSRIQIMIDKGMDNKNHVLQGLINKANKRIEEIRTGDKPALTPDANAKYYAEVVVDLDQVKGRDMLGIFKDNELVRINVTGNSQTVYYPKDGPEIIGMNKAESSDLIIFLENRKVRKIRFITQPAATLYPLKDAPDADKFLRGFKWFGELRPVSANDIFREVKPVVEKSSKYGKKIEQKDSVTPEKPITRK